MGASSTALYDDDDAADVRSEFRDLIAEGLSPEEATDKIIRSYDDDHIPFVYLALADTQWKIGRPVDAVIRTAIEIIDSGETLALWEAAADRRRWQKNLAALRTKLTSPPPAPKKIRRQRKCSTDLRAGDIIEFAMSDGRRALMCVAMVYTDRGGVYPCLRLLGLNDDAPFNPARYGRDLSRRDDEGEADPPRIPAEGRNFIVFTYGPDPRVRIIARDVPIPDNRTDADLKRGHLMSLDGRCCTYDELDATLVEHPFLSQPA